MALEDEIARSSSPISMSEPDSSFSSRRGGGSALNGKTEIGIWTVRNVSMVVVVMMSFGFKALEILAGISSSMGTLAVELLHHHLSHQNLHPLL